MNQSIVPELFSWINCARPQRLSWTFYVKLMLAEISTWRMLCTRLSTGSSSTHVYTYTNDRCPIVYKVNPTCLSDFLSSYLSVSTLRILSRRLSTGSSSIYSMFIEICGVIMFVCLCISAWRMFLHKFQFHIWIIRLIFDDCCQQVCQSVSS